MMTAIRKHLRDFIAVLVLVVIAAGVGGYILSNQRVSLPKWVPIFGRDTFTLKAQLSTAQAVTPGQGQTVNIAGVKVGEISKVDLVNGRAVVTMKIKPKYDAIYNDASVLLRPKTGLKDMILELTPGSPATGRVKQNATIPVQNTLPDINPDEILAALDTDTRDYLRLLLSAAGQGLKGNSQNLSAVFRRFDPTARDLKQINGLLAKRRQNIARVIHNFGALSAELSTKDQQIANFVTSNNAVFQAFANQNVALSQTIQELPSSLNETRVGLTKANRLALALGPTLQALRPGARALGPSLAATRPFLRQSTPIIRTELRPFTRTALPVVKDLRPAISDLAVVTPKLEKTARVVNYLLNELAYNPPGTEEGFLFYASWANQVGTSLFSTQDAHGPIRHGEVIASCSTLGLLPQVASANPGLKLITDLTNLPLGNTAICPKSTAPGP